MLTEQEQKEFNNIVADPTGSSWTSSTIGARLTRQSSTTETFKTLKSSCL